VSVGLRKFEECIEKITYGNKIQRTEYLDTGKFPVVSQESKLINGFWNNEEDLFDVKQPVIVFGDHTRILKFIDFSFVLGADGTKIIKPKSFIDSKFFYYFLKANPVESKGYSRHYRFLKELKIDVPPLPTQQKIVAKLDGIFAEIDTATAAVETNANNAEALFQSYVTEVFESEKYDFKLVKFGTTASFVRGPFGGSLKKSIFVEKGYAVYEQQHAIYNQFSDIRYFIDETKFEEMKRFELKSGDLIMSCSGTMGKIAIVPENIQQGVINQALLKISPNKNVMGEYIARLLSSKYFQDILTKLSGGAAIKNVPAVSVLKDIEVPVPSIKNQKLIIDIIDILESNKSIIKNSYKSKSKELASLKQSILQKAFSGELVKD